MEEIEKPKTRVIACGAIAHEVLAVCQQSGLDHIDLQCLPAIWHLHPEKIAPGLKKKIHEARQDGFKHIFIGYAECGSKGEIDKLCVEENVSRIEGPHCYAFYSGNTAFHANAGEDVTTFFLTDLIARQFDAFVVKPLKLDVHPQLRDMIFGNYEKLVYLAQRDDPELDQMAQSAADYLGLAYERRFTGYGDLTQALKTAHLQIT